ncbi:MAG: WbqC family protein [Alphaproteobacteria bacterium]|nr:WbqC family protein [Alphaproteobacteria bacterium]
MIVAVHQPNYLPWLGYFSKMARCDVFVFLDDVQFSKNSYINRVQIDGGGAARWLTVPVSYRFGDAIRTVHCAEPGWTQAHLSTLQTFYSGAPAYGEVRDWLGGVFAALDAARGLGSANRAVVEAVARRLGLRCAFRSSSEFDVGSAVSDDRLISILSHFGRDVVYLSGKGGSGYQSAEKMERAGIHLTYNEFDHPRYEQGHEFIPGLSIVDALFRIGFDRTAELVAGGSGRL